LVDALPRTETHHLEKVPKMAKKRTKKAMFFYCGDRKGPKPTKNRWPLCARTSYTSFEQKFGVQKSSSRSFVNFEGPKSAKKRQKRPKMTFFGT